MSVEIIKNFIPEEDARYITKNFDSCLTEVKERPGFFEDFGEPRKPKKIGTYDSKEILEKSPHLDTAEKIRSAELISNAMFLAQKKLEEFYKIDLPGYEGGVAKLTKGASNGLHSDMYNLDGTKWEDGTGREDELEFSALLYLSTYKKDFTGGRLIFPKQDISIEPECGSLIFFRGDLDHIHEVEKVSSGNRYALIMFFGRQPSPVNYY
jgi:hypothetical protein